MSWSSRTTPTSADASGLRLEQRAARRRAGRRSWSRRSASRPRRRRARAFARALAPSPRPDPALLVRAVRYSSRSRRLRAAARDDVSLQGADAADSGARDDRPAARPRDARARRVGARARACESCRGRSTTCARWSRSSTSASTGSSRTSPRWRGSSPRRARRALASRRATPGSEARAVARARRARRARATTSASPSAGCSPRRDRAQRDRAALAERALERATACAAARSASRATGTRRRAGRRRSAGCARGRSSRRGRRAPACTSRRTASPGALLDAAHVRVDRQHVAAEREVADRRRRCTGRRRQLGQVVGPAVRGDVLRRAVQVDGAPVVAEPLPGDDHVGRRMRRRARRPSASARARRVQRGITRSTCVCCSITSLTRIAYGSRVSRHGSGRLFWLYQAKSAAFTVPSVVASRGSDQGDAGWRSGAPSRHGREVRPATPSDASPPHRRARRRR